MTVVSLVEGLIGCCLPRSERCSSGRSGSAVSGCRDRSASSRASRARSARNEADTHQPTINRENASNDERHTRTPVQRLNTGDVGQPYLAGAVHPNGRLPLRAFYEHEPREQRADPTSNEAVGHDPSQPAEPTAAASLTSSRTPPR